MTIPTSASDCLSRAVVLACAAILAAGLAGCGGKGQNDPELVQDDRGLDDPNRFLEFFDPQAQLGGGQYRVRASRKTAGPAQTFRLEIDLSNGNMIVRNGSWASGLTDVDYGIKLEEISGAIIRLESAADNVLTVAHAGSGDEVARADDGAAGATESLELLESEIDSVRYARAYYDTIDPLDERTTLDDWKQASGFANCNSAIIEVKFRDTKDLGYGRHMRGCTDLPGGGFAYFVDNYQVDPIPEIAYSDLNLDAVLREETEWNLGTNAIEFSQPVNATGTPIAGPMIAKFFTFEPRTAGATRQRLLTADLDGRGRKAMPMICVQCHGGRLLPLNPDGSFPRLRTDGNLGLPGGVNAKLQAFEVDTFEFPGSGPFSRTSQEEELRRLNASIQASHTMGDYGGAGEWDSTFVSDLLDGWYGDVTAPGATFDESYVPPGWQPDPASGSPPVGADDLFREVVLPRCIVCHGKRGTNLQDDISFATWDDFIGHADQIEELMFDEALMPAALVEFNRMWNDGSDDEGAAMIASFLPDFSHAGPDGSVRRPGRAYADAGPDRTVSALPVTLSAEDSFFADSYSWSIITAPGGKVNLADAGAARATFLGPGVDMTTYVLRLTVTDSRGNRDSDTVRITLDSGMSITSGGSARTVPSPRDIRFDSGGSLMISEVMQNTVTDGDLGDSQACTGCHRSGGVAEAVVWWTNSADQSIASPPTLYDRVMARVNLRDPETSLILRKPSGHHHNGALQSGFDVDDGDDDGDPEEQYAYDMFYTWIVEGAPR